MFNNSPDETAYFRMLLNRENITNSAVMIQPSLISYSFNSLPAPALLDVASIAADRILLLDSYFSVVIFHGMTIAQWRNMGYQNQPEHQVCPFGFHPPIINHLLVESSVSKVESVAFASRLEVHHICFLSLNFTYVERE